MFIWVKKVLKSFYRYLISLFRRKSPANYPALAGMKAAFRNIKFKAGEGFKSFRPSGLPDMPKKQPCPLCMGWRRRKFKALTGAGATYRCQKHGSFFVSV